MIGKPPLSVPAGLAAITRYALLTMNSLQLLIPQNQVHALEPGFDVEYLDAGGVGWIAVAGIRSPVYCLSKDLKPLREAPTSRHICVLLDIDAGLFGVLCDQVVMIEQAELDFMPLPECMHAPDMPLRGLVLHGEKVLCVGSADDLLACLGEKQEQVGEPAHAQLHNRGVV